MSFEVKGMNELMKSLQDLEISEQKQRKVLKSCADVLTEALEEATPKKSGRTKKSIKASIKTKDGEVVATVKGNYVAMLLDAGTSKNRKYVNYWSRTTEEKEKEIADIIRKELKI